MSEPNTLRLIILAFGVVWLGYIWWRWQRKSAQATPHQRAGKSKPAARGRSARAEPTLGDDAAFESADSNTNGDDDFAQQLQRLGNEIAERRQERFGFDHSPERGSDDAAADAAADASARADSPGLAPRNDSVGVRPDGRFERIIALHVVARDGESIAGPEVVVAAERSGLVFGEMDVFHRMVEGYHERGPIFSVANMVRPGSFNMDAIGEVRTPGVTFFMTLPGPLRALDAWDTMLPAAERFAELLDAQVLDEERNALARQTIQHMREELRAYDRQQERQTIKRTW